MFFDKSTATIPHIDSWYLDTLPKGDLLGAWIALEDIRSENGSFYVYPGSHLNDWSGLEGFSHDQFIENILDAVILREKKTYPAYFGSYDNFDLVKNQLNLIEN